MADLNRIGGLHYEMMKRCYDQKSVIWGTYGAKGITVCEEWHDRENFKRWAEENGYVKGLRIERIDSSGNYNPENCYFGETLKKSSGVAKHAREVREHRIKMKQFAGIKGNYSKTRLYRIYVGMHSRCEYDTSMNYKYYGGRGIRVCEEWSGEDGFFYFYKWAMENGYSKNLSIDRIDGDKNYSPDNCRWVGNKEQIFNRNVSKIFKYNGSDMLLSDIAKMNGVKYGLLYSRVIQKGMTVEDALYDIMNK